MDTVNAAIQSGGKTSLLRALQNGDGRLSDINMQNIQWYADILGKALRDKAETEVSECMGVRDWPVAVCGTTS